MSRPAHAARFPLHLTLRVRPEVGSLRGRATFAALEAAFAAAAARTESTGGGVRVVHFSVQGDHVHLLVEAASRDALSKGMQGLAIRLARAINRTQGRTGKVWRDRYHARSLRTPREVRNALVYVLMNWKKHRREAMGLDPCSSARWFDGWRAVRAPAHGAAARLTGNLSSPDEGAAPCVVAARTWLLHTGWRRHGLLTEDDAPGPVVIDRRSGAAILA